MSLNNDISIGIINNNSSSSSIGSTNSSCNSSSSSIENNSNSENVIKTTVNNDNNINYNHINNVVSSIINATNGIVNPQQNILNFGNIMGKNITNHSQNGLFQTNGKNENQNFHLQQKAIIDTTQKMPQLVTLQQQPKPLSDNNFNFAANNENNSKNNYEYINHQQPRPYKRKFSCMHENKIECTPECDEDAGLKRDKKNEYARQQMRKYREKIKSDPVRYMKYLQTERERNSKRKYRKMEKLIKEKGVSNPEEILKLEKREQNRQYREKCKMQNLPKIRSSTQQKLLKALITKFQSGEYKLPENCSFPDAMIQQLQNLSNGTLCKEETLSDTENLIEQDDGVTDSEENSQDYMDCSDDDSKSDDSYVTPTYNRICAVVNCPSRFCNDGVEYFPIPIHKPIRDLWIRQIKIHCQQWEINPNAFICSLHFSSTWFESNKFTKKDFLLKAVPTIFPNASASQFDLEIPELEEKDFESLNCIKNFHKWSKDKMKEQENLLKHQHSILENQSEMNFLQKLKISKIINEINEFKSKYLFAEDVKKDLDNIFDQIPGISMNFPN